MRAIGSRLTYANVVATLALIIALGGGVAYAANTVFSSDIVDGEVKVADLATGSVRSSKIANRQVRTADVRELDGFFEATSDSGSCSGDDHVPNTCAESAITLDRPGKLLVNATGEWNTFNLDDAAGVGSESDDVTRVRGICQIEVDGAGIGVAQVNAERSTTVPNHPAGATMAVTALSQVLAPGPHTAALVCTEEDGDLDWGPINMTVGLVAG
jgi:hypothetical protein